MRNLSIGCGKQSLPILKEEKAMSSMNQSRDLHDTAGEETYQAPEGGDIEVKVAPDSKRLQLLEPFAAWDGKDIEVITL